MEMHTFNCPSLFQFHSTSMASVSLLYIQLSLMCCSPLYISLSGAVVSFEHSIIL